jgi:hypothetical protein
MEKRQRLEAKQQGKRSILPRVHHRRLVRRGALQDGLRARGHDVAIGAGYPVRMN